MLKGILDAEDAKRAASEAVDGIVVSNHGGRQLDCASGTMAVLPHVVDAVGDRLEVLLDGGVRSGHDVYKALALGAKGVLDRAAVSLRPCGDGRARRRSRRSRSCARVFDNAMILTGATKVSDISRDNLYKAPLKN